MKLPLIVGKSLKILLGVVLIPIAVGATQAFLAELNHSGAGARSFLTGLAVYLFIHLVVYKVKWLYDIGHAVLSRLASFCFGGKVVAMGAGGGGGDKPSGKGQKNAKGGEPGGADGGSPLVALSPCLVPVYVILAAVAIAAAGWWRDLGRWNQAWAGVLGALLTFHWMMTLETIQQRKETIASAGYVLSVVLIYLSSLSLTAAVLPWVVRSFDGLAYVASTYDASRALYVAVFHQLFG